MRSIRNYLAPLEQIQQQISPNQKQSLINSPLRTQLIKQTQAKLLLVIIKKMNKEMVKVWVRVRPLKTEETGEEECIMTEGNRVTLSNNYRLRQWTFHQVLDKQCNQQQVFEHCALPLLEDCLKGYSCTLFAFGQNQSGKSFTIEGGDTEQTKGTIARSIDHLSYRLNRESTGQKILLRVSYVQIYEQEIYDLLSVQRAADIQIVEGKDNQIILKNLELKCCSKVDDIESFYIFGNRKRRLAYTKKVRSREKSSCIFTIYIETIDESGLGRKGRIDFVSLPAHEIVNRFEPLIPLIHKDKSYDISLSAFKNVINSLIYGDQGASIPFNDSKITKILRNSFGGSSKANIIVHLNTISKFYQPSLSALRLAASAQMLENTPIQHSGARTLIHELLQQKKVFQNEIEDIQELKKSLEDSQQAKEQIYSENQFISESALEQQMRIRREEKAAQLDEAIYSIRKKINKISSMFLIIRPANKEKDSSSLKNNFNFALERLHTANSQRLEQGGQFGGFNQTFKRITQKQRFQKQESFDLQREFARQRQQLLQALRTATQKYRFYQQVSKKVMRSQEIDIIKMSSKYDEAKRAYEIPHFAIRDKRIMHSSRYLSPQQLQLTRSKSISERKFLISQSNSFKQNSIACPKYKNVITEVRQITSESNFEDHPYFHQKPIARETLTKRKQAPKKISEDQYELVRSSAMNRKLKKRPDTSTSKFNIKQQKQQKTQNPLSGGSTYRK